MIIIRAFVVLVSLICSATVHGAGVNFDGGGWGVTLSGKYEIWRTEQCAPSDPGAFSTAGHEGCKILFLGICAKCRPTGQFITVRFDVPTGFDRMSFFSGAKSNSQEDSFRFLDENGDEVFTYAMPYKGTNCADFAYCNWRPYQIKLPALAYAVEITAPDQRLVFDDFQFTTENQPNVSLQSLPPRDCAAGVSVGNPIEPLTGAKKQKIDLGVRLAGAPLELLFDSTRALQTPMNAGRLPSFGGGWTASWAKSVSSLDVAGQASSSGPFITFRPDGREETFISRLPSDPTAYAAYSRDADQLKLLAGSALAYKAIHEGFFESYTASASLWRPVRYASINGPAMSIELSTTASPVVLDGRPVTGLPIRLYDDFGREVRLKYQAIPARSSDPYASAKVVEMVVPDGRSIKFGYTQGGVLQTITWPDLKTTELAYEHPIDTLLTGVVDEDQKRFSTFKYDTSGRAVSTELANAVNSYSVTYTAAPAKAVSKFYDAAVQKWIVSQRNVAPTGVVVKQPNGEARQIGASQGANYPLAASSSQPAGSGCSAATKNQDFDANGNLAWKEEFTGYRTCYANDLNRNLNTVRVEGLAPASACGAVLASGAALPAGARKITTVWHPQWRYEAQVVAPKRKATWVYNGQPDPQNGNALASCAPASATLADGQPIVVLCKIIEEATTDADGSKGLAAAVDSSVPPRVQRWTYNEYGQVLTYSDPNNNTTTYTYYTQTTADYTKGDLKSVTNPKLHVTTYTKYNPAGEWLEMNDPNGVVTVRTFDARQRLKTIQTGTTLTTYDYWPTGLLQKVTLPDGSTASYGYDDAHRLTSITDSLGNTVSYLLDASGNRVSEEVKDPTGQLAKTLSRLPDALNRIQLVTGRP